MPDDPLLSCLSGVAREARMEAGLSQARVAADLDLNQETVARFERGQAWPRTGRFVYSYAKVVGADPLDIWEEAIKRWRASRDAGT
ncbi:MAG: helix-turn-helix transcriptional regulator [Solirubrobacteraceae bacterium]